MPYSYLVVTYMSLIDSLTWHMSFIAYLAIWYLSYSW